MNRELLSEINRFREIIGLKLINESMNAGTPVQEAIEKILERFGSGTKVLDAAALKSIESSITDVSVLNKLETLGNEISQGIPSSVERMVDDLVIDAVATRLIFGSLATEAPDVFQKIADGIVKKTSGASYNTFENVWNLTKDRQKIIDTARKYGFITDENEIFWEKWQPKIKSSVIPTTSALSEEAKAYYKLTPEDEKWLNEKEINVLNKAAKDVKSKFANLSDLEKVQANNALQTFNKKIDDALTALENVSDPILQKKIAFWKKFWEWSKKNITPENLWVCVKIAATLFGAYLAIGFFSGLCDMPGVSLLCKKAGKKMDMDNVLDTDDVDTDKDNPDDDKKRKKKKRKGGKVIGPTPEGQ